MRRTDTLIVGGGQAGLAMSRCLGDRDVDHVVLERGRIGERWRSERWDSLRLLSPNWQSRLPGFHYRGSDPHGYMTKDELAAFLGRYAMSFSAPVEAGTEVRSVSLAHRHGFHVVTSRGDWQAENVVVATGHCDVAAAAPFAARLAPAIRQLVTTVYKRPDELPAAGVLVVGASATGVQLADEIQASGRPVTLAVGRHTRLPRLYRGRDILWWLDALGVLDERADEVPDLEAARRQPSLQLAGRPDHSTLDLAVLAARGVRLVGSVADADGRRLALAPDLGVHVHRADAKLARLLDRIDRFVARAGLEREVGAAERSAPLRPAPAPATLDLDAAGIRTVLWATGFRRRYDWLRVPVLDARGEIRHRGGITDAPGLYVLGLRFLRRRNSNFLDGVGADAFALAEHLAARRARSGLAA